MVKTILIADDDADVRGLVTEILQNAGHRVCAVNDGGQVLAAADRVQPDLIILDWVMPTTTGLEACMELRALSRFTEIPIVFLTGRDLPLEMGLGFAAGADEYLPKPFRPADLRKLVDELLY